MHRSIKSLRVGLVSLSLALVLPAAAQADTPACGDVITEDIVLTHDLLECPGDGLVAAAPGITIDANYHRVDGTGAGVGIVIAAPDVTLRSALITDFDIGVRLPSQGSVGDVWLADLNISHAISGVSLGTVGGSGSSPGSLTILTSNIHHNHRGVIGHAWTHPTLLSDSTVADNTTGIQLRDHSHAMTIRNNRIEGNDRGVDLFFASATLERNSIRNNQSFGVAAQEAGGTVLTDNTVARNGLTGAYFYDSGVRLERNKFNNNGRNGLELIELHAPFRPLSKVIRNTANDNGRYGIAAITGFTGTKNVALRNGEPAQCFEFPCNSE